MARSKYQEKVGQVVRELVPLTETQKQYINCIKSYPQIFCIGPAGTGKTFVASTVAARLLKKNTIKQIVVVRPNEPTGRSLGFDPGTEYEKMLNWVRPVVDVFVKEFGHQALTTQFKNGNIILSPLEKMRGASFENTFVIMDEAQNTTPKIMEMFNTRIGEDSTVVITGDLDQTDLTTKSGLAHSVELIRKYKLPIPIVEFTEEDIVRSGLCRLWVDAYRQERKK